MAEAEGGDASSIFEIEVYHESHEKIPGVRITEFTKEELEQILEGVAWWLDGDSALFSEKLINKIQSMIDNYCEHEWHPGGNRPWLHCIKCKANFHHERI